MKKYLLIFIVAISCLLLGIFIGKGTPILKNLAKKIFAVKLNITRPAKINETLILSNFERGKDLKKWKSRYTTLEQATEHNTEGKYSGKIVFSKGVEFTNVLIEDFFEDNPNFGSWKGFNQLKFDIYNANEDTESLTLKIKDVNGKSWQRKLFLAPKQNTETKIYINTLNECMDISNIRQFNLFRSNSVKETTFYIDNIRLIPFGAEEQVLSLSKEENISKGQSIKNNKFLFDGENSDFGLGIESALEKIFLEPDKFSGVASDTIGISLARNEYESAQLVIYAKNPLEKIEIETQDLFTYIKGEAVKFDKNNIKCYVVEYIKTREPDYAVSYVGWWPDPLEEKANFNIKAGTVQSIWIEAYAPKDTPPGEYSGDIILKFANSQTKNIRMKIKVRNFSLPKETHLKTAFDFYDARLRKIYPQKEGEAAEEYQGRMDELERKYYLDMIKHRLMPMGNFDLEDGGVLNDLKFYLNNGLSTFAIGKYNGSSDNNWPNEPEKLNELINTYRQYALLLKTNGFIDKAYIYTYDEPEYGDSHVDEVTRMIHKADPDLKNMVCLHNLEDLSKYSGWGNDIDIWCIRNVVFNEKIAKIYRDKGKEVWIYVSGPKPPYPTLVIDYPAMAYRIIPWMCWKYDIKGYLYWCVNKWEDNPWENPVNKWGQNGNGFLYYPGQDGPVTSIRLEVTRDGIEDYEYLYLLAQKIQAIKDKNLVASNQELIKKAEDLLKVDESLVESMADYTKDPKRIYQRRTEIAEMIEALSALIEGKTIQVTEAFSKPLVAQSGKAFGAYGQLTFELYRGGTFVVDGKSGYALQKTDSYRDVAIIRSTKPLPKTYKVSAVVGQINYDLSLLDGLKNDPEYKEGPLNENGVYLLAIIDAVPTGHHTNDWWHQHRKVCIDVDNNLWGDGMPHPVFINYFDKDNKRISLNGTENQWGHKWEKAVTYESKEWYRVEIEKTESSFILSVYDDKGKLLKGGVVPLKYVWNEEGNHPDYLVIGDPHENYYQGSMKIKSISMPVEVK